MMDWTDRHCRYFLRGFSAHALLYTEMITAAAILRGDRARLLQFDPAEHPVALQLGGSEPEQLAEAARIGEEAGYDEINLNCGCPSDRVANGSFGACLMLEPARVAECVAAMRARVNIPVTVKMRIGVVDVVGGATARRRNVGPDLGDRAAFGDHDRAPSARGGATATPKRPSIREAVATFDESDYEALSSFVTAVRDAGCQVAIIHARKAVLGGLSPKDNREIPPLRFDVVRRIKQSFPGLSVVLNGGIRESAAALDALRWSDGVMLGREAYHRPFILSELEDALYPDSSRRHMTREDMLERMACYAQAELARGGRLGSITRHMLGLYGGQPGAKEFRRFLSEGSRSADAGADLIRLAGGRARGQFAASV